MIKKLLTYAVLAVSLLSAGLAQAATPETTLALEELMAGNARFVNGTTFNLQAKSNATTRQQTGLKQQPFATVLDCSDSRLSPEILFDQGLGQVFVVRVAGNVIAPHEIGSIEYAIEHLKAKLVVILGHERCGAVSAAYGVYDANGLPIGTPPAPPAPGTGYYALTPDLKVLVGDIAPSVAATKTAGGSITDCVLHNTNAVATALQARSELLLDPVIRAEVSIVEAFYDIDNGQVTVTAIDGVPTATPATNVHTVIASAGAGGTIAPAGTSAVETGANQPYFITPNAGFAVSGIYLNGSTTSIALPVANPYILADNGFNQTISVTFAATTAPLAAAVRWVNSYSNGDSVKVVWDPSATTGATYTILASGLEVATGVTGTSALIALANGDYTITVRADAAGFTGNAGTASASVTVNKTAIAPAWLNAYGNSSSKSIKVLWPNVATPGATYEVTEVGPAGTTVYTAANATIVNSGSTSSILFTAKPTGNYTYKIRTLAGGFNASPSTNGPAAPVFIQ